MSAAVKRYSVEDYLAFERASPTKHEFFDGEVFAMGGATIPHNQVAANTLRRLGNALDDGPCFVVGSDTRIVCATGLRTYPDVVAICGPPQYEDGRRDTVLNPIVIAEVLSPSTERYDRGKKFEHYRSIPSLREYVLIASDHMSVDHFARQDDGAQWLLTSYSGEQAIVDFPALGVSVPMREIYSKVELLPEPSPFEQHGDQAD